MESKKCTKCGEVKQIDCFSKDKGTKDGYQYKCKSCQKKWRQENKEHLIQYGKKYSEENRERLKQWRDENREGILERKKQWRDENKERIAEYNKQYHQENKERLNERAKQWREKNKERRKQYDEENKERISERAKQWREKNKERISEREKQYRKENKERLKQWRDENREYLNERKKQRKITDPLYKLKCNLRSRTAKAFRYQSYRKTSKTAEMLGVPYEIAFAHIERQFTKGMTWENQGEWHIDHIIPLASAETESELIQLCHYTNLQPLWAFDNISKSDNLIDGTQVKLRL